MKKILLAILLTLSCFLHAATIVEYSMDECGWSGTAADVVDSANGYDAVAQNGADTANAATLGGGICRAGDMQGKYIRLANSGPTLGATWSMTLWMKFPLVPTPNQFTMRGYTYYVIATVAGRGDLGFFAEKNGSYKWGVYDNRGRLREVSIGAISDGWHHVAQVVSGGRSYLYIDGSYVGRVSIHTEGTLLYVGSSTDATNDETVGTWIDEFKLFDTALSNAQIASIYENERSGLEYDGTKRVCGSYAGAVTPLEFTAGEITLKDTYADPTWTRVDFNGTFSSTPLVFMVIDDYGTNPASVRVKNVSRFGFDVTITEPQGEDGPHWSQKLNYFAINEGVHLLGSHYVEVGKVSTVKIQGNYAVGDKGWVEVVPKVRFCDPAVVANIQSLNNERNNIPSAPSSPWMTTAIKSAGGSLFFALERSETSDGSVGSDEVIGYMVAESNIIDAFTDDLNRTISYETIKSDPYFVGWDDGCKRVLFRNSYAKTPLIAGSKNSRLGDNGGWFRRCFLDSSEIGFVVDEDRAHDSERSHVAEIGSIFAFSDIFVVGIEPPNAKEAMFNAVDYAPVCNAVADWERNLTTKTVGSGFDLSILAKVRETGLPMEANITRVDLNFYASGDTSVCSPLPYATLNLCSNGCGVTDISGCMKLAVPASLNRRAARCVQVHIEGRDINASASIDANSSDSSDNFSIRPDAIRFLNPAADANLTAEYDYFYAGGVAALYADGTSAVTDYNTTLLPGGIKRMRNGEANASLAGSLNASPTVFANGSGDLNLSFSDVANLTLFFEDTAWTAVDSDDTPLNQRRIYGERNVTFIPSRFEVQFFSTPYIEDNDSVQRFTYLSNDLNMSAWARNLTVVVTAKGEKGGTLQNFSDPMSRLFADPVDISPLLSLPPKHSAARSLGEPQPSSGADINFSLGQAFVNYTDVPFNYDRSYNTPINPFLLLGSEGNVSVSVTDSTYPAVTGSVFSPFDGNATFYYGRLRAEDIATTHSSTENVAEIEVYDDGASALVSGYVQNSLRWFRNAKHTSGSPGGIKEANVTTGVSLSGAQDRTVSVKVDRYGSGTAVMDINSSEALSKSRTIHLNIDRWLWYVPGGFGGSYDYGASSDCSRHPCFQYTYEVKGGTSGGVLSGDFNGSDFDTETIETNATYKRKEGVKLFR